MTSFFTKQIDVFIDKNLSQEARSKKFAAFAERKDKEFLQQNRRAVGANVTSERVVDGVKGAPLESVKAGGIIFLNYQFGTAVIDFTLDLLESSSPFDPTPDGIHYREHHRVWVDDVPYDRGEPIQGFEKIVFTNTLIYSRPLEVKFAIYEAVVLPHVKKKFGQNHTVEFKYTDDYSDLRTPAIVIRPKQ